MMRVMRRGRCPCRRRPAGRHVIEGVGQGHDVLPLDGVTKVVEASMIWWVSSPLVLQDLHIPGRSAEAGGIAAADLPVEERAACSTFRAADSSRSKKTLHEA